MAKIALLIGVSEYQPGLTPLPAAVKDIEALRRVLQDPEMGGFEEVKTLTNPEPHTMQFEIETLFDGRTKDDLVLLFFSGHGIKDDTGKLYFATRLTRKNSKGDLIRSTAVPASFVHEIMNNSRAKRQAIILDCCFSGAFDPALQAKDDGSVDLKHQLGAEGRVVLTSSSSTQYSFEQQGMDLSIYTRYLVEGIETGAGDRNEDGFISMLELHEYAASKVQETAPKMTPKIIVLKDKGFEILIAKTRITDPKLRYRKTASRYANAGTIRPSSRAVLDMQRQQLGLTAEAAAEIEAEVLRPYQERLANLNQYRETLIAEAEHEYPLSAFACEDLNTLQQMLGLRDEDVLLIQQEVEAQFNQQAVAYQQNLVHYQQVLTDVIQRNFPLNQEIRQELEKLQRSLGLKQEDITCIEHALFQQAELNHQEKRRQEAEQRQQEQEKAEYDNRLRRYEQEFSKAIQVEYPLSQPALNGLKAFQQQLELKDEDVTRIEQPIRERVEAKYREKLKQQKEAEQQQQRELEQNRQKAEYENKLKHYQQEFVRAVRSEYPLSQFLLEELKTLQQQLQLKNEDVARIEQPIREPLEAKYQEKLKQQKEAERQRQAELEQKRQKAEYENKLQRYEQEFSSEIEAEYPLRQESVDWLKNLQQQLGLKDEDIERIDRPIRERAEAKYQEKLRQQAEAERQHQIELEQKRQKAEYEDKLQRYEKAFLGAVDTEYPLRQGIVEWLRNLQKQLGLNERDKRQIEAHVFDALAGSLRDQGKLDEAIAHHRRAIQMNPNHANAHHGLGLTLYHQGKLDESILAYRRAIQLDPKYAIAHNNLGLALYHQGQLEDAIAAYRKAVKLDPNCLDASNNLKAALQEQRQGKKFWGLF